MSIARKMGRWIGSLLGKRPKPVRQETVTLPDLIGWFVENKELKADDVVAFSYILNETKPTSAPFEGVPAMAPPKNGSLVVQGFYSRKTEKVLHSRTLLADRIDEELLESHAGKDMVVYQ